MMKRLFLTIFLISAAYLSFAQSNNKASNQSKVVREQAGRPDIPGDLFIDLGFSLLMDKPEDMNTDWWGSKALNIYYQYPVSIGDSRFSFHPGIGVGTEKFAFNGRQTLAVDGDGNTVLANLDSTWSVNKSKLGLTYLDIPLEIRWRSNKYDARRGFHAALGVKGGLLLQSTMKTKYTANGDNQKAKLKRDFNVQSFRYGGYAKFGFGAFNLYYYYSISTLFESDKGPEGTEAFPMQFGISFALF
ncbi:MAG TPA: hypothetical protein DDY13_19590 [Cytophagales bacterium]|jgi:hypothetical protein|nr:hypothetical protein [Cytophagales bacterium]